jgi:anti-sigma regulatory factor (Ser/Thr protein kinase)
MDIKTLILNSIRKRGHVKTSDIVKKTNYSRAYVHRHLKNLVEDRVITLVGKSNQAHYILASKKRLISSKPLIIHRIMTNQGLAEDKILQKVKEQSAIFQNIAENISSITDYAFTEMLNNAIEHSASEKIDIVIMKTADDILFTITDWGVGILNNIMNKKRLDSEMEAIQDLLKGKETTLPEAHSGEGIFFTSKIADSLKIKSFSKKIVFDNVMQDIYVKDVRSVKGTRVDFSLRLDSQKTLSDLFSKYTDESFEFTKTGVKVKLYHYNVDYVSRSQARRILAGLEKFKTVELDFKDVNTVGQAFADEIFRIWQGKHPNSKFIIKDANENIMLMINRAQT